MSGELDPCTAIVVRGGAHKDVAAVVTRLRRIEGLGAPGKMSVGAADVVPPADESEVLHAICEDYPMVHKQVQVASLDALQEAGYDLLDERSGDEAECHYHIAFPEPVQESDVEAWFACFSDPVPNPAKEA
ncbi:hypothetical protein GCM10009737_08500 [Nocardioides lentus]|uniref:Uncharacterized protein n=1 Tax=Nocardioides lentus TaxID=338077 RepID=A0ABP5ACH3_9ACTN